MGRPDFIGLGAQKSGTSWIYACLYEHPAVCIPDKEIHFFSRNRNWVKGYAWYEERFSRCPQGTVVGEFSTSYLSSLESASRIYDRYPEVRLITCLRHPVERAFSNYLNDVRAGVVSKNVSFEAALKDHLEYVNQGHYAIQLQHYLDCFPRGNLLVLIYEDLSQDPLKFIQQIYGFLGVGTKFRPSQLGKRINRARVPKSVAIERTIEHTAALLRAVGLHRLVWAVKTSTVPERIRAWNTERNRPSERGIKVETRTTLTKKFTEDVAFVEKLLGRTLEHWYK